MNARIRQFQRRNTYLKRLGFNTYQEYLKSPLWKSISSRVRATRKKCLICGSHERLEVHHKRYTRDNLRGKSLRWLCLLCHSCHQRVSNLEKSRNLTPERATNSTLGKKRRPRRLKSPSRPAKRRKLKRLYV